MKYRIRQEGNDFYPQTKSWYDIAWQFIYFDDWFGAKLNYSSLEDAKRYISNNIKNEEILKKIVKENKKITIHPYP